MLIFYLLNLILLPKNCGSSPDKSGINTERRRYKRQSLAGIGPNVLAGRFNKTAPIQSAGRAQAPALAAYDALVGAAQVSP